MLRLIAIIFLFITTSGMVIPCCSVDECCADQISATEQSSHEDEGLCSPFFACSTCPGFIKAISVPELGPLPVNRAEHHEHFCEMISVQYTCLPWQPPREWS